MNTLDILSTDKPPLKARYLNRTPDAGVCTIISIDWEERRISMSNGSCRYFPSFDEIEMVDDIVDKPITYKRVGKRGVRCTGNWYELAFQYNKQ